MGRYGVDRPEKWEFFQYLGSLIVMCGAILALWSIFSFIFSGKGTPAPFDPPRNLVSSGPFKYVRNPMYIGAGMALIGAAVFFQSYIMFGYGIAFFLFFHGFVIFYEEPTLKKEFGSDYEAYCNKVNRWIPFV